MNTTLPKLFLGYLLWLVVTCVYAESPIAVVDNIDKPFDLNPYVETIEDPHHEYKLEDIQAGKYDHLWQRNTQRYFIGKNFNSKYWFRLTLQWQGEANTPSVLYVDSQPQLLARISVVLPDMQGTSRLVSTGSLESYNSRDIPRPQIGFKLPLTVGKTQTIFGWVNNSETSVLPLLPLYLISETGYDNIEDQVVIILAAFYAMMAALWLYNMCLFVTLREPVYGLYILFLASATWTCSFTDGTSHLWLWAEKPALNVWVPEVNGIVMVMIYLAFVKQALNGATFWSGFKKLYRIVFGLGCVALLHNLFSTDFSMSAIVVQVYPGLVLPFTLVLIIMATRKKQPTAGYLLVAEIMTISGGTSYMLMIQGILPIHPITIWALHWGFASESLLLSLALAARTRIAQQQRQDALKNYEQLYEDSLQGFFQYYINEDRLSCNTSLAKMFGWDNKEELYANHQLQMFNEAFADQNVARIISQSGSITGYECLVTSPKLNKPVWILLNAQLIKDHEGKYLRIDGSMIDITDRKQAEQAELDRATADNKNAAKSQFFASMSHELRTPLTAILGYSETAIPPDVSSQQKQNSLEIIHRSGKHLLQIINDILDLSKVEAQKLDVERIQVYLFQLMEEVSDTLTVLSRQKNLYFTIHYQYPLPKIFTSDPTRIKQVLLNLCGNAIKFTESGGVSVDVSCSKEQQTLTFAIKDTGFGLKPEQVDNLFEAFTQADASTTRNYGGTGLGLYLSKQLAQKLGGDIKVASIYGTGSSFTFTVATANLNNAEWLAGSLQTITVPKLSGSVLYAEDNLDNQNLVKAIVEKTGATITLVSNGKEALEACAQQTFDLVFTDIRMPIIDGVELTKALLERYATLPVVAISATLIDKEIEEFRAVGFKEMLRKPVERKAIYAVLTEYLNPSSPVSKTTDLTIPHPTNKPLRVLLAEDNLDNQELIKIHLKRAGAEAIIANDGGEALAKALTEEFDLILMDMQMPNMDGLTAVRYLRARGFTKPIYALTANETVEGMQACENAGCDGHLSKPLDAVRLTALISEIANHYAN